MFYQRLLLWAFQGLGAMFYDMWFTLVRLLIDPLREFPYKEVIIKKAYPVFYLLVLIVLGIIVAMILKKSKFKKV